MVCLVQTHNLLSLVLWSHFSIVEFMILLKFGPEYLQVVNPYRYQRPTIIHAPVSVAWPCIASLSWPLFRPGTTFHSCLFTQSGAAMTYVPRIYIGWAKCSLGTSSYSGLLNKRVGGHKFLLIIEVFFHIVTSSQPHPRGKYLRSYTVLR